jgi:hypothetical protein
LHTRKYIISIALVLSGGILRAKNMWTEKKWSYCFKVKSLKFCIWHDIKLTLYNFQSIGLNLRAYIFYRSELLNHCAVTL